MGGLHKCIYNIVFLWYIIRRFLQKWVRPCIFTYPIGIKSPVYCSLFMETCGDWSHYVYKLFVYSLLCRFQCHALQQFFSVSEGVLYTYKGLWKCNASDFLFCKSKSCNGANFIAVIQIDLPTFFVSSFIVLPLSLNYTHENDSVYKGRASAEYTACIDRVLYSRKRYED